MAGSGTPMFLLVGAGALAVGLWAGFAVGYLLAVLLADAREGREREAHEAGAHGPDGGGGVPGADVSLGGAGPAARPRPRPRPAAARHRGPARGRPFDFQHTQR